VKKNTELLVGIKSICDEFQLTEEQFYMFLGMNMPLRKINGRWYGHRQNISDFFKRITVGDPVQLDGSRIKDLAGGE